jgi:uncharacterized protein (UPF0335 family)
MSTGGIAAERLKSFVIRIRNLRAEIKGIQADVKEVFAEAKGTGFDTKIIRQIITYMDKREENAAALAEQEALFDLYKEAMGLGEGAGTNPDIPLNPRPVKGKGKGNKGAADPADDQQTDIEDHLRKGPASPTPPSSPAAVTKDEATALGKTAGEAGVPLADNPFAAGDPNRAAWDAAWCAATGSDGMDLPPELRRGGAKKGGKKPGKPGGSPSGSSGGDDATGGEG